MKPSLAGCRWPDLPERYLAALKTLVHYVLGRYESTIGIIASGTILRGNPDPSSDFDIYVIHTENYRQRLQRRFEGIPAEIFVNPPAMVEQYFREEGQAGRPITAHMLATGFVVLQSSQGVLSLRERAKAVLQTRPEIPKDLRFRRYMLATAFEDAVDVSTRDRATARLILTRAVDGMLELAFASAGRYTPRTKDLLKDLGRLDQELGRLAAAYFKTRSFRKQLAIAGQIADRVIESRGFFEWESDPDPVEDAGAAKKS